MYNRESERNPTTGISTFQRLIPTPNTPTIRKENNNKKPRLHNYLSLGLGLGPRGNTIFRRNLSRAYGNRLKVTRAGLTNLTSQYHPGVDNPARLD